MPFYESVFIARQDIASSQVDALADSFTETIEQGGGKVAKREYWGLKNLAYRIKKNRKGHYILLNIDAPAAAVQEMERLMRLNDDVLRYVSFRIDAIEEGPSIMMQKREERRERSERGERRGRGDDRRDRGDDRRDRGDREPREARTEAKAEAKSEGDDGPQAGTADDVKKAKPKADDAPAEAAAPEAAAEDAAKEETAKEAKEGDA